MRIRMRGMTGRGRAVAAVVDEIVGSPPPPPTLTPVPIVWRGAANEVFLIRAGDEDWMGRREMTRTTTRMGGADGRGSPTEPFTTTIDLPPGTHHFRFIVDGKTVVAPATEIPNAVDDQGFIANYVAVPGPSPPSAPGAGGSTHTSATVSPTSAGGARKKRRPSQPVHPDGSFWARSSAGGSGEDVRLAERRRGRRGGAVWTNAIPEELVRAAAQEEAWLDAQAQYHQHHQQQQQHQQHYHNSSGDEGRANSRGRHIVLNGFVPEPSIPPAPRLPRHLERLILNRPRWDGRGEWWREREQHECGRGGGDAEPCAEGDDGEWTDVSVPMMSFTSASNAHASSSSSGGDASGSTRTTTTPSPGTHPHVLQTPSHAVLYHLCTSSIRDKMIAIGASTRYRQKVPCVPANREE
ncbi:hypothetical protein B0H13DRAFT_2004882 [Mycena leptocephala]|nr:hypothetical protein B0H13DRAFT_2004882 [Mycena leptocephala]